MNTIYLYDVSALIKSGTNSSTGKMNGKPRYDYNFYSFPTGGLYTFNERFITDYKASKEGDVFIACFDGVYNKLLRKQRYSGYKANRGIPGFDDNPNIDRSDDTMVEECVNMAPVKIAEKIVRRKAANIQLKFLRKVLTDIGVNILYDETLEADDWIYSVCYHFGQDYKIVLYADDGDLDDCASYCTNFVKRSVSGRGTLEPKVGKNFYKIFHGEIGDGYPNLYTLMDKYKLAKLRDAIIEGLEDIEVLKNNDRLENVYGFLEHEIELIQINYDMVNPIIAYDFELSDANLPNHKALLTYLSSMRFKMALKRIDSEVLENEEVTNLQKYAFSLLPNYVKEFYKKREFRDGNIDKVLAEVKKSNDVETSDYILQTAAKYNIL